MCSEQQSAIVLAVWSSKTHMYVPCNLKNLRNLEIALRILRIWKLCSNLEIAQPIMRMRKWIAQSQDYTSAICEHNGLTGWKHLSWLMEENWDISEMVTLHRSGVSLCPYPNWREGSLSELANLPEVSGVGGLSTSPTLMVMTELQELLTYIPYLYTRWKLEWWPTEIARSRDRVTPVLNLEIGTQFPASENVQHNLKIEQIPRLRGTCIGFGYKLNI